jgi:hypothetical protein
VRGRGDEIRGAEYIEGRRREERDKVIRGAHIVKSREEVVGVRNAELYRARDEVKGI